MTCVVICDWHDFSLHQAGFAENEDLILHFASAPDCQPMPHARECEGLRITESPLGVWAVFGTAVKIRWSVCHWLLSSTCHTVVRSRSICQKALLSLIEHFCMWAPVGELKFCHLLFRMLYCHTIVVSPCHLLCTCLSCHGLDLLSLNTWPRCERIEFITWVLEYSLLTNSSSSCFSALSSAC